MKTHTTRRPLLGGLLLAVVALTLVNGTASVRADDTRSLPTSVSTRDASGQPTPLPYFWTENNDAQIHIYMFMAPQAILMEQRSGQYYLGGVAMASTLAARALD